MSPIDTSEIHCLLDRPGRPDRWSDIIMLPLAALVAICAVAIVVVACYAGIAWGAICTACAAAWRWFRYRIVCSWCQPKRRIGGNPWARHTSHSICPSCAERTLAADPSNPSDPSYNSAL